MVNYGAAPLLCQTSLVENEVQEFGGNSGLDFHTRVWTKPSHHSDVW